MICSCSQGILQACEQNMIQIAEVEMCVWSAYAGKKQAAPILLEAMKKTEGWWAGFYTGMATCDGGKLFFEKCAGHTGIFEAQYDLAAMPGTTGVIHSRTESGGGANRAHPFVGTEGVTE